jgi:hypothetical protein
MSDEIIPFGKYKGQPLEAITSSRLLANPTYALGDEMADHDYKNGGLHQKYHITKTSGEPVDESAVYFVLRVDEDPHARKALLAYADSVASENEILASDLRLLFERFAA